MSTMLAFAVFKRQSQWLLPLDFPCNSAQVHNSASYVRHMTANKRKAGRRSGPDRAATRSTPRAAPGDAPRKLIRVGKLLKAWREAGRFGSQKDLAESLNKAWGTNLSQSFVAQLETGKVTNPDAALLRRLTSFLVPQEGEMAYRRIIAALNCDKYDIPEFSASFLYRDIKDVEALGTWESNLEPRSELWIAAPNFVDADNPAIRSVVVSLLKNDCKVVYFVDARDAQPGGKFDKFRRQLAGHPEIGSHAPWVIPLDAQNLKMLSPSAVIARPLSVSEDAPPEGYMIVNKGDGTPEFGIKMTDRDVENRVASLNGFLVDEQTVDYAKPVTLRVVK